MVEDDGSRARAFYETGCLCIHRGELEVLPDEVDNWVAVKFYNQNCKCSRNRGLENEYAD